MTKENANPHFKAAVLEVVENQLRNNNPAETGQTYKRLVGEGHSEDEAKRLIGCVVVSEIFDILKKNETFDRARFVSALIRLPAMPWDE